jgi:glucose/arabinose dehydrogenase
MPAGDIYGAGGPSGIVSYEGDLFGEKWRGMILSADTVLNSLLGYVPTPEGAGFKLERFTFLTTNKEQLLGGIDTQRTPSELKTWFRPSDVTVGPDGAIYIADWFDRDQAGTWTWTSRPAARSTVLRRRVSKASCPGSTLPPPRARLPR